MGYCVQSDVEAALGRPLNDGLDVSFLIETASDLIDGYLNNSPQYQTIPDPTPALITRVAAEIVASTINRPETPPDPNDTAYNIGGFAYHTGPTSVGPWLTQSQKDRLDQYGSGGLVVFGAISEVIGSDVSTDILDSFDPYAGTDLTSQGGGGGFIPVSGS